jgi:hypothetical protein
VELNIIKEKVIVHIVLCCFGAINRHPLPQNNALETMA